MFLDFSKQNYLKTHQIFMDEKYSGKHIVWYISIEMVYVFEFMYTSLKL